MNELTNLVDYFKPVDDPVVQLVELTPNFFTSFPTIEPSVLKSEYKKLTGINIRALSIDTTDPEKLYERRYFLDGGEEVAYYRQITSAMDSPWEVPLNLSNIENLGPLFGSYLYYKISTNPEQFFILTEDANVIDHPSYMNYSKEAIEALGIQHNGEYSMDVESYEGYILGAKNPFSLGFVVETLIQSLSNSERTVQIELGVENGRMDYYPKISRGFSHFKINYELMKPTESSRPGFIDWMFNSNDTAIKLETKNMFGFFSFINSIYFDDNETFEQMGSGHNNRSKFYDSYLRIAKEEYRNRRGNSDAVLELLYFLPPQIIINIERNLIWDLLKEFLGSALTNATYKREDAILILLQTAKKYEKPKRFLDRLVNEVSEGQSLLSWIQYRFQGDNYQSFLRLIWEVWKNSEYSEIDPDKNKLNKNIGETGPVYLPYKSDKTLGFNHDNASIYWGKNSQTIRVNISWKTGNEVDKLDFETDGFVKEYRTVKVDEVIHDKHVYHPFSPIIISKTENPTFMYTDAELTSASQIKLPAFILLAREKKAAAENWLTGLEYALDIATTFSGVGNILKAGRLLKLLNAGKKLAGTTRGVTQAIRVVKLGAGAVEITSGVGNGLIKLMGLKDTEGGRAIAEYLFFLEMLSLSGELTLAIKTGLKKSAQRALQSKEVKKAISEAEETLRKNTDELGEIKKSAKTDDALETLEVKEHLYKHYEILGSSGNSYNKLRKLERIYQPGGAKHEFEKAVIYLSNSERKTYEVFIQYDRVVDSTGTIVDTSNSLRLLPQGKKVQVEKAIFVMSEKGNIYLSKTSEVGKFHHSSFLAGEKVAAAGEITIKDGIIISINNASGHYKPIMSIMKSNMIKELNARTPFVPDDITSRIEFKETF